MKFGKFVWCDVCSAHHSPGMCDPIVEPGEWRQVEGSEWAAPALEEGYPDDNPKTRFGLEKIPLHLVPPSAIHSLANAFADGAQKYGPFNWRMKTISATVYYAAVMRHLTAWYDGEDNARDSGKPHLDHAQACIAMMIDAKSVGKLNDNRPPKGAAAEMQELYGLPKRNYPASAFSEDKDVALYPTDGPPADQEHP